MSVIDYEKIYATCSGLPISLKIQATAAMKMNLATKFDLESYIKHPENANFALKIVPRYTKSLLFKYYSYFIKYKLNVNALIVFFKYDLNFDILKILKTYYYKL